MGTSAVGVPETNVEDASLFISQSQTSHSDVSTAQQLQKLTQFQGKGTWPLLLNEKSIKEFEDTF